MATYHVTATTTGKVWKAVTCAHCHAQYTYLMSATGRGTSSTGLARFEKTEREARDEAEADLRRSLRDGIALAFCPSCGWYQPNMIWACRRRHVGFWAALPLVPLALAPVFAAAIGPDDLADGSLVNVAINNVLESFSWPLESGLHLFLVAAAMLALVIQVVKLRFDPNVDAAGRVGTRFDHVRARAEYESLFLTNPELPVLEWT